MSGSGPWTPCALRIVTEQEGTAAPPSRHGARHRKDILKRRVHELEEMGLTESLPRRYRLAPCGAAVLSRLG